jgi:tetratricopeptide (TPR) repeat protein
MASLMEKFEHFKEAKKQYLKGFKLNKNSEDIRYELHCLLGLGRLAIKSNQLEEGTNYLQRAEKMAESLNAKPLLFEVYMAFAELLEKQNKHAEALAYYKKFQLLKE